MTFHPWMAVLAFILLANLACCICWIVVLKNVGECIGHLFTFVISAVIFFLAYPYGHKVRLFAAGSLSSYPIVFFPNANTAFQFALNAVAIESTWFLGLVFLASYRQRKKMKEGRVDHMRGDIADNFN